MSEQLKDANFSTGAVRSADVDHLDFASLPLMGLLGVIAVAGNGGIKYGRHNYAKGMPVHVTLNHVAIHLIRYILGDRKEDHLSKVAWGAMVANETAVKNPELAEPHMLGAGAVLTKAMIAEMDRGKPERDARRQAGEFESLFSGTLADMPEIKDILGQRESQSWTQAVNKAIGDAVRNREKEICGLVRNRECAPATENETPPEQSSCNPAVDTFVRDNLAKPCPPKPCPLKACPRPDSHVVPVAPAPCAHENIDLLEEKCRDCGLTKKQIVLSRPPLKPFEDGEALYFGLPPKSFCDCGMPLHNGRCNRCGRTAATGNTDYLPRS